MFFWVTVRIDRLIKKDQVYDRLGKLDLVERKRRETEGLLARDPRERERERESSERGEHHRYASPLSRHIATKVAVMVDRS
jgi:hypothetical protein